MSSKIRLAIIGLGRLGMEYLDIVAKKCKNADIVSACSLVDKELTAARKLGVANVYNEYEQMLAAGGFDALLVLSSSHLHSQHIIQAIEAGYHVFSEKPLGITLEECLQVLQIKAVHQDSIVMVGFVRRFDDSYLYAMEKVKSGAIGKPYYVRSQTADHSELAAFQLKFMKNAGSIYLDYNVHDIDVVRWFLQSEITEVYSLGGAYKFKEFKQYNSVDNSISTCSLINGTMAHIVASRTCPYGHATAVEIWASDGWLTVGCLANQTQVEWGNKQGITKGYAKTFFERFQKAFYQQLQYFIDCVALNRQPKLQLKDALQATSVAIAMQESFDKKKLVRVKHYI